MIDEGYIKYEIQWEEGPAPEEDLSELIAVRNELFDRGLIGVYADLGVGYGNVSQRWLPGTEFVVSGTQTGHLPQLTQVHFSRVTGWDLTANRLHCQGPLKASSESLTHAAIYDCVSTATAILHVHHLPTWKYLLANFPSTAPGIAYGTPEMAREVYRLYSESQLPELKVFAMTGHEEGVFAFGDTMAEAKAILLAAVQD